MKRAGLLVAITLVPFLGGCQELERRAVHEELASAVALIPASAEETESGPFSLSPTPAAAPVSGWTMPAEAFTDIELPYLPQEEMESDEPWRFVISPYGWLLQLNGNATIMGTESRIDESFHDLLDQLSFVAEGRFEAWKGPWGGLLDVTYAKLENDSSVGVGPASVDIDSETDIWLVFAGGLHRFVEQKPQEDGSGGLSVDGFLGVAYTSIDGELDFSTGPDIDGDEDWWDPLVGLRTRWNFSKKWGGSLQVDVGGFDLFDGSDLVTFFEVLVGRVYGTDKVLYFGYRSLFIDYDNGDSGTDEFEFDVTITGPVIGFEWQF